MSTEVPIKPSYSGLFSDRQQWWEIHLHRLELWAEGRSIHDIGIIHGVRPEAVYRSVRKSLNWMTKAERAAVRKMRQAELDHFEAQSIWMDLYWESTTLPE